MSGRKALRVRRFLYFLWENRRPTGPRRRARAFPEDALPPGCGCRSKMHPQAPPLRMRKTIFENFLHVRGFDIVDGIETRPHIADPDAIGPRPRVRDVVRHVRDAPVVVGMLA